MASKMYIVVEFEKEIGGESTIEVLPETWRDTEGQSCFLYPLHYSSERVIKAAKRGEAPTDSWKSFPVTREWYKTASWEGANRRCDKLLDTSNPESDGEESLPPKRMKRVPRRFMFSDCDNAEDSSPGTSSAVEPPSPSHEAEIGTVLPSPPPARSLQGNTLFGQNLGSVLHQATPSSAAPKHSHPASSASSTSSSAEIQQGAVNARFFHLFERVLDKLDHHEVLLRSIAERQEAEGRHQNDEEDVVLPSLPCGNKEELRNLDKLLDESSLVTKKLTRSLSLVGGHSIRAVVANVLKELLTHELSKQLNLTGAKGKMALMECKALHQIILKSIRRHTDQQNTTDQEIHKTIGKWFTNSRDRHGDRAARIQRQGPVPEPAEAAAQEASADEDSD